MVKPKLIGLVGFAGSGKTTLANKVNATRISFSDPIVEMLKVFGISYKILHDKTKWQTPLDILGGKTVRHAAQTLGTEWGRNCISEDVWLKLGVQRAREIMSGYDKSVIIDNVRFLNEFEYLSKIGATLIAIHRASSVPKNEIHESEKHILKIQSMCYLRIFNEWTVENAASELQYFIDN